MKESRLLADSRGRIEQICWDGENLNTIARHSLDRLAKIRQLLNFLWMAS